MRCVRARIGVHPQQGKDAHPDDGGSELSLAITRDDDILWCQVAVDQAFGVTRAERIEDVLRHAQHVERGEWAVAKQVG